MIEVMIVTMTGMLCLIVWIVTEMATAFPMIGTGARTIPVATNYLQTVLKAD
jgi:hypothetical protein